MKQLSAEVNIIGIFVVFPVSYRESAIEILETNKYIHFGIARNARIVTAPWCPRRTSLSTFVREMYKGWYSLLPVATETVVLSLPRTMPMKQAPFISVCLDKIS